MALQDHERAVPHGVFPYIGVCSGRKSVSFPELGLEVCPVSDGVYVVSQAYHTANSLTPRRLNWKLRGSYLGHLGRFDRVIDKLTSGFSVKGEVVKVQLYDWLESVRALGGDRALSSEGINPRASLDHGDLMDTAKVLQIKFMTLLEAAEKNSPGTIATWTDRAHREYFGEKNTEILKDLKTSGTSSRF
ncbi:hypothetical protein KEM48_003927 [Puccinia striiformis f. sp. tritici PST-130]|nr:hypothetical protein KEM48_003927 [Puccinia striiformis f. sp. tritici PST-130]